MVKSRLLPPEQTHLLIEKSGDMKPVQAKSKVEIEYKENKFTCPYCLYEGSITHFFIKLKSGRWSEKRFMCPDCGKIMNKQTLVREMTVEELAEWVLDTMAWERISFNKFKTRLKEMGISWQFWEHYKKHKKELMEEGETPSYEQYLEDQQKEYAKEEGYVDEHG